MSKKQRITYNLLIDKEVSFSLYNNSLSSNNSSNIKRQYEVLKLIIAEQLTEKQRKILNMYYNLNLTIPEISEKIGRNKSTVSRSLKRSRKIIQNYMRYNNFRQ